ncbi:MAG: glycosyltransferase family 39 protein, partial [Anaerolineae bacterium]
MKVRSTVFLLACALALLAGAGLRALGLADVPPRWDEGWSVAHASLPLAELFRITAADVHPPLYYMILGAWQNLVGENIFVARYLSLLLSITAIPLTFVAARAWSGSRRVGLMAAALMAWLPLAQYYGGVVRMYALAPSFVMLAVYGGVKGLRIGSRPNPQLLLVIGSLGAMLTLYHAAWALLALG